MFDIFKKLKKTDNNVDIKSLENEQLEENQAQERQVDDSIESDFDNKEKDLKSSFGLSFSGLKQAIAKTSESIVGSIFSLASDKNEIDDDFLDEMEERLIKADIGVETTVSIIEKLRKNKNKIKPDAVVEFLKSEFSEIINSINSNLSLNIKDNSLNIILITGVNGAGKTTLIGKLAYRFKLMNKKVVVAAGDTFRAAAEEQLEIWSNRAGAQIVRQDGADPAAVVFDAIKQAKKDNADILLIDTAGRLQNKFNLMEELKKIKRVIDKEAPDCIAESLLVLDATTGQNGLKQAEIFKQTVQLTSVALTKLDGTSKGGIIVAIANEFKLPVKLVGIGEKMEDLKDFDPNAFIEALFS